MGMEWAKKKVKKENRAEQEVCLLSLGTCKSTRVEVVFIMTNFTPLFLFGVDLGFDIFI